MSNGIMAARPPRQWPEKTAYSRPALDMGRSAPLGKEIDEAVAPDEVGSHGLRRTGSRVFAARAEAAALGLAVGCRERRAVARGVRRDARVAEHDAALGEDFAQARERRLDRVAHRAVRRGEYRGGLVVADGELDVERAEVRRVHAQFGDVFLRTYHPHDFLAELGAPFARAEGGIDLQLRRRRCCR